MKQFAAVVLILAACSEPAADIPQVAAASGTEITVYKTPTCGCCTKWVEHMESNGFAVNSIDVNQAELMRVKQERGMKPELSSCHTAVADGYTFEGHVPAELVRRFLAERPRSIGLAVPGMPMGSPGMEGFRSEAYDVLEVDSTGGTDVYQRIGT